MTIAANRQRLLAAACLSLLFTAGLLTAGLLTAGSAFAQPAQAPRPDRPGAWERIFDRLDTNKDGFIDRAEFEHRRDAAAQRRQAAGKPRPDNAPGQADARFARLDKNGDGKISRDEFTAARRPDGQRQRPRPDRPSST